MSESTMIRGDDSSRIFVDRLDDKLWLSIHTRCGGSHCQIPMAEAQIMLAALQELLNEKAVV